MFLAKLRHTLKMVRQPGLLALSSDMKAILRLHFLFAAFESGLLAALKNKASRDDLVRVLGARRPELLDVLLDLGLGLGELAREGDLYALKGKRAKSLADPRGDALAAVVQANVTYYNSIYRHFTERMKGAPSGDYLGEIGEVVARFSKLTEPFIRNFVRRAAAGRGPLRILEIGCGSGIFLKTAYEANPQATGLGIDLDEKVAAQARRNIEAWGLADRFETRAGDIRRPEPEWTGAFDLITLYNVVYYFPPEERADLLRSLKALLRPGGAIALVSTMQSRGRDAISANLDMAVRSMRGCWPLPDLDELTGQFRRAGFTRTDSERLMPGSWLFGILAE